VSGSTYDFLDVALALLDVLLGVSAAGRLDVLRDADFRGDFAGFRGILVGVRRVRVNVVCCTL
jgi:hypothetical protein